MLVVIKLSLMFFKVPEAPKKIVPEEKVPKVVPEAPTPKGIKKVIHIRFYLCVNIDIFNLGYIVIEHIGFN